MPHDAPITAVRALIAVRAALAGQGLHHPGDRGGDTIRGWSPRNVWDTISTNIGLNPDGLLNWNVEISGKGHLQYETWTEPRHDETDQGETIDLHEPVNPESLIPRIVQAFQSLGIDVRDAAYSGHQSHWDDGVSYRVTTSHPAWLDAYGSNNVRPSAVGAPTLASFGLKGMAKGSNTLATSLAQVGGDAALESGRTCFLVGYQDEDGSVVVPREALEMLTSLPVRTADAWLPQPQGGAILAQETASYLRFEPAPDGTMELAMLRRLGDYEPRSIRRAPIDPPEAIWRRGPETIRNAWGDDVLGWRFPPGALSRTACFVQDHPVLIQGAMRDAVSHSVWDSQFGVAPWTGSADPAHRSGPTPPGR